MRVPKLYYTRAYMYYIYVRTYAYIVSSRFFLLTTVDNQSFIKKTMFYDVFYAPKFGQSKKKQYLCTRFAPEVSELLKRRKSH